MRFTAVSEDGAVLHRADFYSVGGGFVLAGSELDSGVSAGGAAAPAEIPHPFRSADELLQRCRDAGLEIHELVRANERAWRAESETTALLLEIWTVMQACIQRGFEAEGLLPGSLRVRRRAPRLFRQLQEGGAVGSMQIMDWVNAFALAVN